MQSEEIQKILERELVHAIPALRQEKNQVDVFLRNCLPEINMAIGGQCDMQVFDRLIGRAGRISLGTIHRERTKAVTVVYTALRILCNQP